MPSHETFRQKSEMVDKLPTCLFHRNTVSAVGPPLVPSSYTAHNLVHTVKQRAGLLEEGKKPVLDEKVNELGCAIIEGLDTIYENDNPRHYRTICKAAVLIDQLFFSGQLTQVEEYSAQCDMHHLKINIEDRNARCEGSRSFSSIEKNDDLEGFPSLVHIEIDSSERQKMSDIMVSLMHEMAHGYLDLFSCRGGICSVLKGCSKTCFETPPVHGLHVGHIIHDIAREIRSWAPQLMQEFATKELDCCPHRAQEVRRSVRGQLKGLFRR